MPILSLSCVLLLEAPARDRQMSVNHALTEVVGPRVPDLSRRLGAERNARDANRALDRWLMEVEASGALRGAHDLERRARDEQFAQSFGRTDGLIDELSDAFIAHNQMLTRAGLRGLSTPSLLSFSDALDAAAGAFRTHADLSTRVRGLSRVLDSYLRLRADVELSRTLLLTGRPSDHQVTFLAERRLFDAIVTVGDPRPTMGTLTLFQLIQARNPALKTTIQRYVTMLDHECSLVAERAAALRSLVDLAKAASTR